MSTPERYCRHRFPIEVVEQCVWLYFRFALSYRNVQELMAKPGVQFTYETIREWCHKFGPLYAAQLRKKRARIGSKWHLDEVFLKMNGVLHGSVAKFGCPREDGLNASGADHGRVQVASF